MKSFHLQAAVQAVLSLMPFGAATVAGSVSLTPVVVTANRMPVPAGEALASVTVLERADIERSQAPDLLGLLSRQAGIDVARTGGAGQASTLFTRGSNSSHTLMLIDGIRVNAATQGIFDLAHLPLAQVERIEIVRGPRAAVWGSDAIGGVIHIFTRDPSRSFAAASAGSYGSSSATVGIGAGEGDSRIGVAAGFAEAQGFSATNAAAFGHDPDSDGYRNQNLGVRARTELGTHAIAFSGLVTDANVEFDQGRTAALNRVFGISASGRLADSWTHSLTVGRSSEDLDTPVYGSRFGSTRTSVDWINTLSAGPDSLFNIGINLGRETGYSLEFGSGFDESRRNAAVFGSWRGSFGMHLLEASIRHDDNSQFEGASTGSVAWGWQARDNARLRASWGQGFRAPNFNELYYPGFFGLFAGNPALLPEHSDTGELGLDWKIDGRQSLAVSLYRTRIRDLIAFQGPDFQAVNVASASIDGAELEYRFAQGALDLRGNATWQDARDGDTGAALLRRANRKAFVSADYQFPTGASAGIDLHAVSARPDFGGTTLAGYARVDVRASAPLAPQWHLEVRVENIGNRDYALLGGYNTPGRSATLGVRWDQP